MPRGAEPDGTLRDPARVPTVPAGAELRLSSHGGDGQFGGVVLFEVDDVDRLFAEFTAWGVAIQLPPKDWTRGQRELTVRDPDRNSLPFCPPLRDRWPGERRFQGTHSPGAPGPRGRGVPATLAGTPGWASGACQHGSSVSRLAVLNPFGIES